ncbi:MAG: hypothetical protein ACRD6W_18535 [Nitrososphaerales archaeon]
MERETIGIEVVDAVDSEELETDVSGTDVLELDPAVFPRPLDSLTRMKAATPATNNTTANDIERLWFKA